MRKSRSKKLTVTARRRKGVLVRLDVNGHAGFASSGYDIVCAAASALVMSAAQGIGAHCGVEAIVADDPRGSYVLEIPDGGNARAQAVLETTLSGLRAIANSYPRNLSVRELRTGGSRKRAEKPRSHGGA